ncbi:MAG: hypothetical protein MJ218_02435 [Opitutales bacterium]|nr:hypothetical protein [Opitutales bacterium]
MISRRNMLYFIGFVLLFWTVGPLMVWVIDPYHLFHETRWNKNLHATAKGSIYYIGSIRRHFAQSSPNDTLIVGSSHTASFAIEDINRAIHAKGVMLCLGGAHKGSLAFLVKKSLKTGKMHNVVWGIDAFAFSEDKSLGSINETYFRYPLLTCFNWQILLKSFSVLLKVGNQVSGCLTYDYTIKNVVRNRDNACRDWVRAQNLAKMRYLSPNFSNFALADNKLLCAVDDLIHLAQQHPNVNFYLPIAPVSWLWCHYYNAIPHPVFLQASFTLWRHLVTACADLPNVKIYGWHDCPLVSNLANYCDESHYHPDINRYMAWCIEHDKHRLTKENYDAYEARCVENLRAFKILDAYPHRDTFEELVAAEAQK